MLEIPTSPATQQQLRKTSSVWRRGEIQEIGDYSRTILSTYSRCLRCLATDSMPELRTYWTRARSSTHAVVSYRKWVADLILLLFSLLFGCSFCNLILVFGLAAATLYLGDSVSLNSISVGIVLFRLFLLFFFFFWVTLVYELRF